MSENLIYNISKEAGAQILSISTRTIDRYISSGRLSTKKIGNKVMLAQEEITQLKSQFEKEGKSNKVDVISENNFQTIQDFQSQNPGQVLSMNEGVVDLLNKSMDEKFDKFFNVLDEKDKILEEKNKLVLGLQNRVVELETKIQSMIALPDYNNEKAKIISEKEKLEIEIETLTKDLKGSKRDNNYYLIAIVLICILIGYLIYAGK